MLIRPPAAPSGRPTRAAAIVLLVAGLVAMSGSPASTTTFPDVPPENPFAVPIDWAVTSGVTTGFDDGTFRPTIPVSRQAFAAFLRRATTPDTPAPPCAPGPGPFTDVPSTHPFCAEITWLVDEGIAAGFDDGTFRPTASISRQAMAAFLFRAYSGMIAGPCPVGSSPFTDVPTTHPFCPEIRWLVDEGIAAGYDDGTFRPTEPISRQAGVTFLWRALGQPTGVTERVSIRTDGGQADGGGGGPHSMSADGRYVAFVSQSTNLVPGDTNLHVDVFVHDRHTGTTERVSVASDGTQANGASSEPSISADGRYVAFTSQSTNLVANDTNVVRDVFVHDRTTGATDRVSVHTNGSQANGPSFQPAMSADGRYVAFTSEATNLVANDTNADGDVFVHDRATGTTTRVSLSSLGFQANGRSDKPSISADGRYVAYRTFASNVVPNDTNLSIDIILHDRSAPAQTANQRVSVASGGTESNGESDEPSISADGRYVAFSSAATNLVHNDTNSTWDVFVHDRTTGSTTRMSVSSNGAEAQSLSGEPVISADGRYVAFSSGATNLVPGDTNSTHDVFVRDRTSGTTERMSVRSNGVESNGYSSTPAISATGRYVAFTSNGNNLVPDDTNLNPDVFVRTRIGLP